MSLNLTSTTLTTTSGIQVGSNYVPLVASSSTQLRCGMTSAASTQTVVISFGYTFSSPPYVFVQLDDALTTIPANLVQNVSTTGATVKFNSSTSGLGTLKWFAFGTGT